MRRFWFGGARRSDPAHEAAERLHAAAVAAAREPELYAFLGAPDTVEGRFELLTAHVILLLERLRGAGAAGSAVRQALFDAYVSHLDGAMREMGVGDLSMARRMKGLAETFYGRAKAWDEALVALPDISPLISVVERTTLAGSGQDGAPLVGAFLERRARLAGAADDVMIRGDSPWN